MRLIASLANIFDYSLVFNPQYRDLELIVFLLESGNSPHSEEPAPRERNLDPNLQEIDGCQERVNKSHGHSKDVSQSAVSEIISEQGQVLGDSTKPIISRISVTVKTLASGSETANSVQSSANLVQKGYKVRLRVIKFKVC